MMNGFVVGDGGEKIDERSVRIQLPKKAGGDGDENNT